MDKFGHFFEFMAAFNAAFMLSKRLREVLFIKVNSNLNHFNYRFLAIKTFQDFNIAKLNLELAQHSNGSFKDVIEQLSYQSGIIYRKFATLKYNIERIVKEDAIPLYFDNWCIYGFLYSLGMLLSIGFGFDQFNFSFAIFNVLSILVLLFSLISKVKYNIYYVILVQFFTVLLFTQIINYFNLKYNELINLHLQNLAVVNIIISILIPVVHFIHFLIKSFIVNNIRTKMLTLQLNFIEKDCEKFSKLIQQKFDLVNSFIIK